MKSILLMGLAPSLCHAPIQTTGFWVVESIPFPGHLFGLIDFEQSKLPLRLVVSALTAMVHIVMLFAGKFGKGIKLLK